MKSKKRNTVKLLIRVAIALALILGVLIIGVRIYKSVTNVPIKVRVTNVTANSATISWITDKPAKGVVLYSEEESDLIPVLSSVRAERAYDDRDYNRAQNEYTQKINDKAIENGNEYFVDIRSQDYSDFKVRKQGFYYTHHVTIRNLDPEKKYYFKVGDTVTNWDVKNVEQEVTNKEMPTTDIFAFQTFSDPSYVPTPNPAYGRIIATDKNEDGYYYEDNSKDSMVFGVLSKSDGSSHSEYFSSVTNDQGGWYLDKANARDSEGNLTNDYENGKDFLIMYVQYENVQKYGLRAFELGTQDSPTADLSANTIEDINEDIEEIFKGFTAKDFLDPILLSAASKAYAYIPVGGAPLIDGMYEVTRSDDGGYELEEDPYYKNTYDYAVDQIEEETEIIENFREEQKEIVETLANSCSSNDNCADNEICVNSTCKTAPSNDNRASLEGQVCVGAFSRGCFADVNNACYCQWMLSDGITPSGAGYSRIDGDSTCIPSGCYGDEESVEKQGYTLIDGAVCKSEGLNVCKGDVINGCLNADGSAVIAKKDYGDVKCSLGKSTDGIEIYNDFKTCKEVYGQSCEASVCRGTYDTVAMCKQGKEQADSSNSEERKDVVWDNGADCSDWENGDKTGWCNDIWYGANENKSCYDDRGFWYPCSAEEYVSSFDPEDINIELVKEWSFSFTNAARNVSNGYIDELFEEVSTECGIEVPEGEYKCNDKLCPRTLTLVLTEDQKKCFDEEKSVATSRIVRKESVEEKYVSGDEEFVLIQEGILVSEEEYQRLSNDIRGVTNIEERNYMLIDSGDYNVINTEAVLEYSGFKYELGSTYYPGDTLGLAYEADQSGSYDLINKKICLADDPVLCIRLYVPQDFTDEEVLEYLDGKYEIPNLSQNADWDISNYSDEISDGVVICTGDNCKATFVGSYRNDSGKHTVNAVLPFNGDPDMTYTYTGGIGADVKFIYVAGSESIGSVSGDPQNIMKEAISDVKGVSDSNVLGVYDQDTQNIAGEPSGAVLSVNSSGLYNITLGTEQVQIITNEYNNVSFYTEVNGVEGYQEGEDTVIQIDPNSIEKVTDIYEYPIKKGINMLSFPFLPLNSDKETLMATELLALMNQNGTKISRIAHFENGKWDGGIEVLSNLDQEYAGVDFPIYPGKGYLLMGEFSTNVQIPGLDIISPMPVELGAGWNFVGINGYNQMYTADTLIDDINKLEDITVDNVTWWPRDLGKYEGYQKENSISYGFDYPISDKLGYFIKVSSYTSESCKSLLWNPDGDMHNQCGEN